MIERTEELLAAGRHSRVGRALIHYGTARGALMAGGIAYTSMSLVFAVLVIGAGMLMVILGQYPTIRAAVVDSISSLLPGVISTGNGRGLISVEQLILPSTLDLGPMLMAGASIYSVIGLMDTLKIALWAMFGLVNPVVRLVVGQLANIARFLVIVAEVLVTAVTSVVTTTLSSSVGRSPGLPQSLAKTGTWVMTLLPSFLIDTGVPTFFITVCGIRPPQRDLLQGCIPDAFALDALRQAGTEAVGSMTRSPLLASFVAIAVLILWLHLTSRVMLLVATWVTNPPLPHNVDHPDEVHTHERLNYVALSVPATLAWPRQPIIGGFEVDPMAYPDYTPLVSIL